MEVKLRPPGGDHVLVQCTKGLGRLSVILFGAYWTFLHKDDLSDEMKEDFIRLAWAYKLPVLDLMLKTVF